MFSNVMKNNTLGKHLFQPASEKLMLDLATDQPENDKKTEKNRPN